MGTSAADFMADMVALAAAIETIPDWLVMLGFQESDLVSVAPITEIPELDGSARVGTTIRFSDVVWGTVRDRFFLDISRAGAMSCTRTWNGNVVVRLPWAKSRFYKKPASPDWTPVSTGATGSTTTTIMNPVYINSSNQVWYRTV